MKNYILFFSLLITLNAYSQESTLDVIAKKTCEYLETEEISQLESNQKILKLGVFIITLYSDYEEDLKKEGVDIDFSEDNAGSDFGEMVGIQMASFCPQTLIALAGDIDVDDEDDAKAIEVHYFTGDIKSIEGDDFSFIKVESEDGITQKFLWFSNFIGSNKIISSDSMIGTKVKVTYKNTECYSPKLEEYIIRKEIVEISYPE